MATYQDGNSRRATANTVTAMKRSAESRRCPKCQRKSAMQFVSDDFGFGSVCRWCGPLHLSGADMTETDSAARPYCPCGGSCHFAESPCSLGCMAHNAGVRHRPMRALDDDATCVCLRPDDHPMHQEVRLVR